MGFGNEPTGCVIVGVPAYAFGLWAIHRYVGGWEWYWWIAAVIGPIFSVFILMLIVMINDRGKKGEIVLCPKCGKYCGTYYPDSGGYPYCKSCLGNK